MSKKKQQGSQKKPAQAAGPDPKTAPAKGGSKTLWILGGVIGVIVVVAFIASGGKGGGGSAGVGAAPPEEAKYIGRFLPAGYEEPNIGGGFSGAKKMTPVQAAATDTRLEVAVADVSASKIVSFEYVKSASETIPMVAYVKPSGKLFVGVSYCVPCQGTGQDIGSDGTLTCQSCGTKRDLESGVGISGACKLYPLDELPAKVVGDKIVIEKSALDGWTVQPTDRPVG